MIPEGFERSEVFKRVHEKSMLIIKKICAKVLHMQFQKKRETLNSEKQIYGSRNRCLQP